MDYYKKYQKYKTKYLELIGGNGNCRVPGCSENHTSHYCRFCECPNSSHFSKNCPRLSIQISQSSTIKESDRCPDCGQGFPHIFIKNIPLIMTNYDSKKYADEIKNAAILLLRDNGTNTSGNRDILMVQNSSSNQWMLPGGRRDPVSSGLENKFLTALREFHEETSVKISDFLHNVDFVEYVVYSSKNGNYHTSIFVGLINTPCRSELPYDRSKVKNSETKAMRFFNTQEIYTAPFSRQIVYYNNTSFDQIKNNYFLRKNYLLLE
jgi:8-oxo-dGTP pyrophosphatase MutT (NUDIX family)